MPDEPRGLRFPVLAALAATASLLALGAECGPWRSSLYPTDWTPAYTDADGRFLHDFSYAGYANGELEPPASPPGATFDVTGFGADPTGTLDATVAIQAAIDAAELAGGGIVYVPAGLYRVDDLLRVDASGVVVRGDGPSASRIYFTRFAGMTGRGHLSFQGALSTGGELPLVTDGASRATTVEVADASTLAPGDEVAVGWLITDEFIAEHGMTGTWQAFNGQWRAFFRRTVTAVDTGTLPHRVELDVPLRYPAKLRDGASLRRETGYLRQCGLESVGLATAVAPADAWTEEQTHAVRFTGVADCWVRDVASFDSPYAADDRHLQNGGLKILDSKRVTVADTRLEKAQHLGDGGSGYLFEISRSNEILIRDSIGLQGRHNFIQNWDFGTTGSVFLRVTSGGGFCQLAYGSPLGTPCSSEFHHSLAMANLIDGATLDDGWLAANRHLYSTGAGITATENVFWNSKGAGRIGSWQYGWGYVIGTRDVTVVTTPLLDYAVGTEPYDFVEGLGQGADLEPVSLYEDQLARRLATR